LVGVREIVGVFEGVMEGVREIVGVLVGVTPIIEFSNFK
jgi:hypothetical protein